MLKTIGTPSLTAHHKKGFKNGDGFDGHLEVMNGRFFCDTKLVDCLILFSKTR